MKKAVIAQDILKTCEGIAAANGELSAASLMCEDIRISVQGIANAQATPVDQLLLTEQEIRTMLTNARACVESYGSHELPGSVGEAVRLGMNQVSEAMKALLGNGSAE